MKLRCRAHDNPGWERASRSSLLLNSLPARQGIGRIWRMMCVRVCVQLVFVCVVYNFCVYCINFVCVLYTSCVCCVQSRCVLYAICVIKINTIKTHRRHKKKSSHILRLEDNISWCYLGPHAGMNRKILWYTYTCYKCGPRTQENVFKSLQWLNPDILTSRLSGCPSWLPPKAGALGWQLLSMQPDTERIVTPAAWLAERLSGNGSSHSKKKGTNSVHTSLTMTCAFSGILNIGSF